MQAEQLRVLPPAEFAPLLIERLERVKRELDNKERLERRLAEVTVTHDISRTPDVPALCVLKGIDVNPT